MDGPIVTISDGKVRGVAGKNICGGTIYKFLGIPYAKPPIGDLRFKGPQPVEPWDGVKDATRDGDASLSRDIFHSVEIKVDGSENCLVLNVFTKEIEPTDKPKPVMVYIHGGGFVCGSNNTSVYGPEFLLTRDVVLVVINYRLGIFGFLSSDDPTLDVPGNAGLKDQNLALKWVQKNIKSFNGDPGNVTIFGESAGGASVHFHVLSSASRGLFHKAILMSGAALCPWALGLPNIKLFAQHLGKPDASDSEILASLKTMPAEKLFELAEKAPDATVTGQRPLVPVVEKPNPTAFLTKHPFEIIKSGEYNKVPMMIGYVSHEGLLLEFMKKLFDLPPYQYSMGIPWFVRPNEAQAKKIVEIMSRTYKTPEEDHYMLAMDSIMTSEIIASVKHHLKTSNENIFVYRISVETKRNFLKYIKNLMDLPGTSHADELAFLFDIQAVPKLERDTLESLTVERFVNLWTNFATYGNPTPETASRFEKVDAVWPPSTSDKLVALGIGKDLELLETLPEQKRLQAWKEIFQQAPHTFDYLAL
ncbi:juvenile hormone esterase-like [Cylas formicarius]|uniref:juvenile hormone esterase-like n=1 Tax=Cylas formicarius TaxID=197179 RepID=UPI0029589811|nr:juvenile hormone esterase-like [Cylas formicarius]